MSSKKDYSSIAIRGHEIGRLKALREGLCFNLETGDYHRIGTVAIAAMEFVQALQKQGSIRFVKRKEGSYFEPIKQQEPA